MLIRNTRRIDMFEHIYASLISEWCHFIRKFSVVKSITVEQARPKGGGGVCVMDATALPPPPPPPPTPPPFGGENPLLACYRGWWRTKIPLSRVWKMENWPKIFKKEKTKLSESLPPPPPPPHPLISFFRTWATFEAGGRPVNICFSDFRVVSLH